jgi:hypothetical protein
VSLLGLVIQNLIANYYISHGEELARGYVVIKEESKGQIKITEEHIHDHMKDTVSTYSQLAGGVAFTDEVAKIGAREVPEEAGKRVGGERCASD